MLELHLLKHETLHRDSKKDDATAATFREMNDQIKELRRCQEAMKVLHDNLQQYGRRDILEFWGIAQEANEDTTYIILDFLESILGLRLSRHDISISHRQRQMHNKDREKFPDPIYVKVVNRWVKQDILYRKKKYMHRMKQTNVFIVENLTQRRRELLATAREKLPNFKFIWVKEGNIFVRKFSKSRVHKITSIDSISKLSEVAT